jgi:hypothetical protein
MIKGRHHARNETIERSITSLRMLNERFGALAGIEGDDTF